MSLQNPEGSVDVAAASPSAVVRVGLIGRGIQGSLSPGLHMREAAAQGFALDYALFDLDAEPWLNASLEQALAGAEARGLVGVNVTHPFKQAVLAFLHELSPEAERLGAVNTVLFRKGRRIGHNTDWYGFAENLRRGLPGAAMAKVVQVGAGGAGAAVAYALLNEGVGLLTVVDTDHAKVADLVAKMQSLFGPNRAAVGNDLTAAVAAANGLVNATPVGMTKHPGTPVPDSLLRPDLWVAEIVYVPIETQLLAAARGRGCRVLDGGGMTVFQAADAFRLFTGRTAQTDRMRQGFLADVEKAAARR